MYSYNSNYSLLSGLLRWVPQTISYEVSLALILLCFLFLVLSLNMIYMEMYQRNCRLIFICLPISLIWFVCSLTNRTLFDFVEWESELVSGFNVEYSSFSSICFNFFSWILSMLFCLLFLEEIVLSIWFYVKITFMPFLWIWVRGTSPRCRYDKLMYLAWKSFCKFYNNIFIL